MAAIERGFINNEIQNAAYNYQMAVEKGEKVVVGVNRFTVGDEPKMPTLHVDPAIERQQAARLAELRRTRDNSKVSEVLTQIEQAARTSDTPLMPLFVAAVEHSATLGEICKVLRNVFGEYRPNVSI